MSKLYRSKKPDVITLFLILLLKFGDLKGFISYKHKQKIVWEL